jgi:hypothetical protein
MSILGIRWSAEEMREVGFAAIDDGGGTFVPVGLPLENPAIQLYFLNATDTFIFVSFNGEDDHIPMPAGTNFFVDIGTNRTDQSGCLLAPVGRQISVAYAATPPTTGNFFVSAFYAAPPESI